MAYDVVDETGAVIAPKKFHDKVVDDYLAIVQWTQSQPQDLAAYGGIANRRGVTDVQGRFNQRAHQQLRERIRDARIFEIAPEFFINMDREVDLYLTEQVAGQTWTPNEWVDTPYGRRLKERTIDMESMFGYAKAVRNASQRIGVPNPRPFDVMWLGMGSILTLGSRLNALEASYIVKAGERIINPPSIVGILMSDDYCAEVNVCTISYHGDVRESMLVIPLWQDDVWLSPEMGHPWLLNAMVMVFNQQDTLVIESPIIDKRKWSQRRWWQQQTKAKGIKGKLSVLPPMYYIVTVKPSTQREKMKLALAGARNWTHRWDVRGHPLTKADGGYKPLDPARRMKLLKRGYTIIEDPSELTDEQASVLMRHKLSFPSDVIWAATRTSWRRDFVKGPADKPYIPATWRLQKERNE